MRRIATAAAVRSTAGFCLVAGPLAAQDKTACQAYSRAFAEAFDKGGVSSPVCVSAEDAFLLPPGADPMRGRSSTQRVRPSATGRFGNTTVTVVDAMPRGIHGSREVGPFTIKAKGERRDVPGNHLSNRQKVGCKTSPATVSIAGTSSDPLHARDRWLAHERAARTHDRLLYRAHG